MLQDLTFRHYVMKLKLASDMYNDEQKVRSTVVAVQAPNFVSESKVSEAGGGMFGWLACD